MLKVGAPDERCIAKNPQVIAATPLLQRNVEHVQGIAGEGG